jgi:cytochrome c1
MNMKKVLLALLFLLPGFAVAAGGETPIPLDAMSPNLEDQASLQRGAKTYLNYCIGCHSLKYQRYQRTADDLGIPADLMMEHMVFDSSSQIGSLMDNAMSVDNAKQWFGAVPPDLTMYTMLKGGPEYFYTYMRAFYEDETRPLGVNNLLYENVAMPHPLVELQGLQRKVCKQIPRLAENGGEMRDPISGDPVIGEQCGDDLIQRGFSPLELVEGTGSLTPQEYDQVIYDLANFLYYTADPSRLERERIGIYVLLFLAFFFVFTWLLGREYTKDLH